MCSTTYHSSDTVILFAEVGKLRHRENLSISSICAFIHSFNKHLLSAYSVPGPEGTELANIQSLPSRSSQSRRGKPQTGNHDVSVGCCGRGVDKVGGQTVSRASSWVGLGKAVQVSQQNATVVT